MDSLGEQNGVPVRRFPANWERFGRAAGMYRNAEMARYASGGIILWDGDGYDRQAWEACGGLEWF